MKREIKIPETLEPERIMDTIKQRKEREKQRKRQRRKKGLAMTGAVAAAICLLTGAAIAFMRGPEMGERVYVERDERKIELENVVRLESYDQLYEKKQREALAEKMKSFFRINGVKNAMMVEYSASEDAMLETSSGQMPGTSESIQKELEGEMNTDTISSETEYSGTNVQTEEIDEGDIVKTDGKYIYYLKRIYEFCETEECYTEKETFCLKIYRAEGVDSGLLSETDLLDMVNDRTDKKYSDLWSGEMYLYEDKLILITALGEEDSHKYREAVLFLDISDRENPVLCDVMEHRENITDSRLYGNILYLTGYMRIDTASRDTIPAEVGGQEISEDCVYMTKKGSCDYYTVIGAFDLENGNELVDSVAYLSDTSASIYMSKDNIYLYETGSSWMDGSTTCITRIGMNQGQMELCASALVDGCVYGQFAFDEYNGYLRVVTTEDANNLYVLNQDLQIVGSIENIAEGESIQSARYMGDIGYFVTYRQTDPLFSVDLSDPENPEIIGELKIPGFSTYLHFINKDTLIGIGNCDEDENEVMEGIKVSTFDISDPADVREVSKLIYEAGYSESLYDHNAILAAPAKNLYGFGMEFYDWYGDEPVQKVYKVISYTGREMKEVETIRITTEGYIIRGIYIGEYLYVIYDEGMEIYQLSEVLREEAAECLLRLQ